MKQKMKKRIWKATVAAAAIIGGALLFWPNTERKCREGVFEACTTSWYAMEAPGGDTLYFTALRADSVLEGVASAPEAAQREFRATAFFVSFAGRLLTAADSARRPERLPRQTMRTALEKTASLIGTRAKACRKMMDEMAYYARTHSVADEGFHEVMAHYEWTKSRFRELERCRTLLDTLLAVHGAEATLHERHEIMLPDTDGNGAGRDTLACRLLARDGSGAEAWQTLSGRLPDGRGRFRLNPFPYEWLHPGTARYTLWARWGRHGRKFRPEGAPPSPVGVGMTKGLPRIPLVDGAEGAPAFGRGGNLNGMWAGGRFLPATRLYRLSLSHSSWAACRWEDLKAWIAAWHNPFSDSPENPAETDTQPTDYISFVRNDSAYYGQARGGRPDGEGVMHYPDSGTYAGHWKNGLRDGFGRHTSPEGRTCSGYWQGDTLRRGSASDGKSLYLGFFNRALQAHGEGEYTASDGAYYVGKWKDGLRDGFGFALEPHEVVKCGVWAKGRFKGEQMLYHSERVYGIDISKYQHFHRHRRYGIDWKRLRITHLGHISKKLVQGSVDYPVSFVYVKCTEGQTVTNPYYAQDVREARRHGYPVGAYHFFSTRPAARQAAFFLKKARLRRGDLPPMLDMELDDRKIAAMGGRDALFREMLVWLEAVERHCSTTPIIYVNQNFVNRHMPFAPERLKDYPVWVARYGEYKPYVHLLYWQLSPDGTVEGIRSRVDINVFNGSEESFKDYLRKECVK